MASLASRCDVDALPIPQAVPSGRTLSSNSFSRHRRRIPAEVGRGLEILGHAIEYLADEHALECRSRRLVRVGQAPQVAAIELLMERNRTLYFSCEVVPTLADRFRLWFGLQRA
jgi:hypothetical protein